MTTAFLAEVDTAKGTMYVGKKGKFSKLPFFFAQSQKLKELLKAPPRGYSLRDDYYSPDRDREQTRVVVVDDVQKGLRASTGSNLAVVEFLIKEFGTGKYAPTKPINAVFKIRLAKGLGYKKYSGGGKFGKTWERQGDVRLHITNNLDRLSVCHVNRDIPYYRDAEVVMIELDPQDGITPQKITSTPILEFYLQSPSCRDRWNSIHQTNLSSFGGDLTKLSPYA